MGKPAPERFNQSVF